MFAKFSPDGGRVAYVRENNLYVENLADGRITQLTSDGSRTIINGTFDWVYEEELSLRDGFRWSPDGRRIAYWQLDASGVRDFLLINNTDSLYSFTVPVQYPKAGTTNSAGRVGVVSAEGGNTAGSRCPAIRATTTSPGWSGPPSSNEVVLQHLNRLQNTNDVMLGDAATGKVRTVLTERDSAWVDVVDDLRWVDGGKSFTWVSERDGWRHLYVVSRDGKKLRLVTKGAFDLHNPGSAFGQPFVTGVDSARGWIYYTASPENATQLYLYRSRLDGKGKAERVTPQQSAGVSLLPDFSGRPLGNPHLLVIRDPAGGRPGPPAGPQGGPHPGGERAAQGGGRAAPTWLRRFCEGSGGHGLQLDGWVMKPADFDSTKRYPVLFHVYGEPAAQTALDHWGGGNYLWHLMLTQQGYVVASWTTGARRRRGDGRSGRSSTGRSAWSTSSDQAAAARTMRTLALGGFGPRRRLGLERRRLDDAQPHVPLPRAVPDRDVRRPRARHPLYDTIYQERYMGLPQENAADYKEGSALTYADKLRGNLLVVHGSGDDNVHYPGHRAADQRPGRRQPAVQHDGLPQPDPLHLRGRGDQSPPVLAADQLPGEEPGGRR